MVIFKFNPAETGLRKTLREYEEIALRYIWSLGDEGAGSRKTWEHVNEELGESKSISRASIIFYLNRMVDEGILGFRDATGKGGHHRIYITKLDEREYKKYIVRTLLDSVAKDFPKSTVEVLQALQRALIQRDKANLDIIWIKDESLLETENLPEPEVLAEEIIENLRSALEQFEACARA